MKYRKIILISSILALFLINNHIHSQSKSKEALGNALVESIKSKNIDSFKALLLPQKVALKLLENNAPENIDKAPSRIWDWHDLQFLRKHSEAPE